MTTQKVRLGDFLRIKHGYAFKSKHFAQEGDFVVLTPGNFNPEGGIKLKGPKEKYYTKEPSPEYILEKGDLVVVMTDLTQEARILGASALVPSDDFFLHNQRLGKVVDIDPTKLDKNYLYHLFNWNRVREQLKGSATGATVKHTAPDRIYSVEVPLPPIETQKQIAAALGAYDRLIEINKRRIGALEEINRRTYVEWFVKYNFPGGSGQKPSDWITTNLSEVCKRITDGAHKSPPSVPNGAPMASVKDMTEWGFNNANFRTISAADYDELVRNDCRPLKNDILIAKDGANLNKHTFLVTEDMDIVLLSSIAIVRPNDKIRPEFLVAQLKDSRTSDAIKRMRSGAAIPRIVLRDFKRLETLLPPLNLQDSWLELAGPIASLCRTLIDQNYNLAAQRDLLLPRFLSGEVEASTITHPFSMREAVAAE